jgi:putative DNA primase/helicase
MNILKLLAGEDNHTSFFLNELAKSEYNRQLLDGKLFNISEETPTNAMVENTYFKSMVAGGAIQVRSPFKDPYFIKNKAKLVFSCNDMPGSDDVSYGFFRRLIVVPFKHTFSPGDLDYDPYIEDKMQLELSGIFNLALRGYQRLKLNRGFTKSGAVDQAGAEYEIDTDNVYRWAQDTLKIHTNGSGEGIQLPLMDAYTDYKIQMEQESEKPRTYTNFSKQLRKFVKNDNKFIRTRVNGHRKTCLLGVSLENDKQAF